MQPHSFSQWMLATFNFRITVVYLTCLENLEGALTITAFFLSDCAKEWLSRSRLTKVLLLPFRSQRTHLAIRFSYIFAVKKVILSEWKIYHKRFATMLFLILPFIDKQNSPT